MQRALRELAWLTGCYALSFVAAGAVIGYKWLLAKTLDIQLHNVYFILPTWVALLPLFLAAALPVTLVRAAQDGFRDRSILVVLSGVGLLSLAVIAVINLWIYQTQRPNST